MPHRIAIQSRRGAYIALVVLTLIWGSNWIVMKLALERADPVIYNVERTWVAVVVLFTVLLWRQRPLSGAPSELRTLSSGRSHWRLGPPGGFMPASWIAVVVTGFFQTTINFGSTTMALAGGGAGRTSVLVFTMPFWTLIIAWPVLHERVRGSQWAAIAFAFAGLALVVEPWSWSGDLSPKLWAVLSGFGWAAGTIATKYYQRRHDLDMLSFIAWQMLIGVLPLTVLPLVMTLPGAQWSLAYAALLVWTGAVSTATGFLLWIAVLRFLAAGTASLNMFAIPVIALLSSMAIFGERLSSSEWTGIALIGAGLAIVSLRAWRASRRGETLAAEPTPLEGG